MSWYREQLEVYLSNLEINADVVFDIGGGALPINNRVKIWNVGKYTIFDNGLEDNKADTLVVDLDLNYPLENPNHSQADVIFCLEVFEYIFDPLTALKNIHKMLKPNGKLYITFPFVYPMHQPVEQDYLRYTRYGVYKLLEETGFNMDTLAETPRIDRSGLLGSFYVTDGMHPAKGEDVRLEGLIVCIRK